MKVEDLMYQVAGETLKLLEEKYHYRISEDHKKGVQQEIKENLNRFIEEASSEGQSSDDS